MILWWDQSKKLIIMISSTWKEKFKVKTVITNDDLPPEWPLFPLQLPRWTASARDRQWRHRPIALPPWATVPGRSLGYYPYTEKKLRISDCSLRFHCHFRIFIAYLTWVWAVKQFAIAIAIAIAEFGRGCWGGFGGMVYYLYLLRNATLLIEIFSTKDQLKFIYGGIEV